MSVVLAAANSGMISVKKRQNLSTPGVWGGGEMRLIQTSVVLLAVGSVVLVGGCGRKPHSRQRAIQTPARPPAPTPDTTPIVPLRTPAGLVLKVEQAPPQTSTPGSTPPSATAVP